MVDVDHNSKEAMLAKIPLVMSRAFILEASDQYDRLPIDELCTMLNAKYQAELGNGKITVADVVRAWKIMGSVIVHDRYVLIHHWLRAFKPFNVNTAPSGSGAIVRKLHEPHSDFEAFTRWAVSNRLTQCLQDSPVNSVDLCEVREIFTAISKVIGDEAN